MKKTNEKRFYHSKKKILKSKLGMTYVELLTALALLSLIVVTFTPMLLQSYETIYTAGEIVEKVYDSKEDIEEGLAKRDSTTIVNLKMFLTRDDLAAQSDALFNNISVMGTKVISTVEAGLETVFGQVIPRLELISPSTVYDDKPYHDIEFQTFGIDYNMVSAGPITTAQLTAMPSNQIHIEVVVPNKSKGKSASTTDASVYDFSSNDYRAKVLKINDNGTTTPIIKATNISPDKLGRLKIRIGSPDAFNIDFTYSPLKLRIYYKNKRGYIRELSEYIFIDPPTIMMAGESSSCGGHTSLLERERCHYCVDYFTSAGIQSFSDANGNEYFKFEAAPRTLRTTNSAYLSQTDNHVEAATAIGSPSNNNTIIRSIRWIDNDETAGIEPYYVMVGNNGSIYRMYNFSSDSTTIYGRVLARTIKNSSTGWFGSQKDYIDGVYNTKTGEKVYPSMWSGDYSDIFEYASSERRGSYGPSVNYGDGDKCWTNSADGNTGVKTDDNYDTFAPRVQYAYMYSGYTTGFNWPHKDNRLMSYILNERGYAIRLLPVVSEGDDFADFYQLWDTGTWEYDSNAKRILVQETESTAHNWPSQIYAFKWRNSNQKCGDSKYNSDNVLAPLRIKVLASYPMFYGIGGNVAGFPKNQNYANYYNDGVLGSKPSDMIKLPAGRREHSNIDQNTDLIDGWGDDVELSDAVYIPSSSTTKGEMLYLGTVHAYAAINQTDKIDATYQHSNGSNGRKNVVLGKGYKNDVMLTAERRCYPAGAVTNFMIFSDVDGRKTMIVKYNDNKLEGSYGAETFDDLAQMFNSFASGTASSLEEYKNIDSNSYNNIVNEGHKISQYGGTRAEFFLPRQEKVWSYITLDDVFFTFGYSSNRERIYKNIVYDGQTEYMRSYERYYYRSHYGQDIYGSNYDGDSKSTSAQSVFEGSELSKHIPNRAVCGKEDGVLGGAGSTYINDANNDYYNAWFPGEMLNYTKAASKDGVTVVVGYAVAASTYQYSHWNADSGDSNRYSITSTAMGGIYNDGVLGAMIEGSAKTGGSIANLLYYKDNESFDGISYSNYPQYKEYSDKGYGGYGPHTRDSVQFTAVDLLVDNITGGVNYVAYYGDSKGRVFYSTVAYATKSAGTEDEFTALELGAKLVPLIEDRETSTTGVANAGVMKEVKIKVGDGLEGLDYYYKNIGTIDITGETIIITGEMSDTIDGEYIVVGFKGDDGEYDFYALENADFESKIYDAAVVGGYYYITGEGWVAGVAIETLLDVAKSDYKVIQNTRYYKEADKTTETTNTTSATNQSSNRNHLLWVPLKGADGTTDLKIYAIAGRDTQ